MSKFLSRRVGTREQVNEWKEAIGIPNEVIQDNISAIFKRRHESETRVFCDHLSFFSFHEGIQMRQAVKMDVQGVTLRFLIWREHNFYMTPAVRRIPGS